MQDGVRGQILQLDAVHEEHPPNKLMQWERQPPDDVVEEDDPLIAPGARDDFFTGATPLLLVRRKLPLFLLIERGDATAGAGGFPHDRVGRFFSSAACGGGLECASSSNEQ